MQLPQFNHILIAKIQSDLEALLADNLKILDAASLEDPIAVTEMLENRLQIFWSPIAHLHAVKDNEALRQVYNDCLPLLSTYGTTVSHHQRLYQAFCHFHSEDPLCKRIVSLQLRDFHLAGVNLPQEKKIRYGEIEKALSELSAKFSENVLDATQAWSYSAKEDELEGIPLHLIPLDRKLTLDYPCYSTVQKYAQNRALREKCYVAYTTRASEVNEGHYDNTDVMYQILLLKSELAELLGFEHYAQLSLATKMASSAEAVLDFLNQLVTSAKPAAEKELLALTDFAEHPLAPWDIAFYAEKLNQKKYGIHQELLRPYFPVVHVLAGLFNLISELFGLSIQRNTKAEVWESEVSCFEIYDKQQLRGIFYIDLYTRSHKREGAWMDDYCSRYRKPDGSLQIPVAYITCNFMRPHLDQPGLLTHDDVITLFHEFGHGLHHLLTTIEHIDIAGINGVPWDAVELPSQFMENFCWHKTVLKRISKHYQSGETLPDALIEKLQASRYFHAGLMLLRQLEFGLFDFHLHLEKVTDKNNKAIVMQKFKEIHEKIAVMPAPDYTRFPHTFSHIFGGGYAAGYYSYLWAEVLACDAFALFEENGVVDANIGQKFLETLLSQGGSQPPDILFKNFRGRAPDQKAFLKSWGLL